MSKDKELNKKITVSIITITQLKRFNCLEILRDLIKDQTYDNIIEWVIVEGSKKKFDAELNKKNIDFLKENSGLSFPIKYIEFEENIKLGELRNKGNKSCEGDITVCMDDDDYYPPSRVSHSVDKLSKSNAKIAGCSAVLIYDYFLEKLYKFKQFGPNHSTNNCMAWKKSYLISNKHDGNKEMAEEASFTNNFSEPMVQLESEKTIVVSSHDGNTFNKRELLVGGSVKINPSLDEIKKPIIEYIKEPFYSKYKEQFVKQFESKYDIVYLAGGYSIKWDPEDKSLGGSEQAIVNLVNNWTKMGKKVAVYGEVPEKTFNGVDYMDWKKFPFEAKHKIVILWRLYGLWCGAPFSIKAEKIWLDCHDNFGGQFPEAWNEYGKVVNKIFFKSEFHREEFEKHTKCKLDKERYIIIPNGIRVEDFKENKEKVIRNPFRFCYCSCYMRGLSEILQYVWPIIYNYEPRAELHVYYGMNNIRDENVKKAFLSMLCQPGVMDHGRQPVDIISREKHMSSFHLYLSISHLEIDCISIRESLATGCIPILSNYGVFKDREGIHFDIKEKDVKSYQNAAVKILQIMAQQEKLLGYREQIKKSSLITSWDDTAKKWLNV
jgi:glycosyltransferase involved in cell wall biosynthesis